MKLKSIAASVVALTALSSHAASTDWAAHGLLETGINIATSGSVSDTYLFSLAIDSKVESSVLTVGNLVGGGYSLHSYGTDGLFGTSDDASFGAWATNGVHNVLTLDAGSYYYTVTGDVTGTTGYVISSAATAVAAAPVPEPETYALLGAGLGIVGFVASRRRRDY